MTDPKLTQFKLLCFDVYATLIDWESGIYDAISPILVNAPAQKPWSRKEVLSAFTSLEVDLQAQNPSALYSTILADTYYTLAKRLNLPENDELQKASVAFGNSVSKWPVFPDSISALRRLSKHFRLVVLSNVDKENFAHTQSVLEQGFKFDLIITAEEVGRYKPDLENFEYMLKSVKRDFGLDQHEVLVTAQSLFADHMPANKLGIASSWIAREGAVMGLDKNAKYVFTFPTLGAMADALEAEIHGAD